MQAGNALLPKVVAVYIANGASRIKLLHTNLYIYIYIYICVCINYIRRHISVSGVKSVCECACVRARKIIASRNH